jgi:hypothetical protein
MMAEQIKEVPRVESVQEKPPKFNKEELRNIIRTMPTREEYERQKLKPKG